MKKIVPWLIYTAALLCLSAWVYAELLADFDGRVFADNDDSSLFIWWIAHTADVVAGWFGRTTGDGSLLYTTVMNAPVGVNGAWNTSLVGIGLPLVPVTWLFGPVVSYNLAIVCAPVVSALTAALLIRRFTRRAPAFFGGALYGFSTYTIAQASGHLNLAWAAFPPLVVLMMVLVAHDRRWAVPFGIVLGWQFYISTELLAGTFLAVLVLSAAACLTAWSHVRRFIVAVALRGSAAAGIALVIASPLLFTMWFAPNRPRDSIRPHGVWNTDVLDVITPGPYTRIGTGRELPRVEPIDPSELGGYLSILWLVVCLAAVVLLWKCSPAARTAACTGFGMWALSLGSPIFLGGEQLLPYGPFRMVELIPVLSNILPMRLMVHVVLACSVLSALLLNSARRVSARALIGTALSGVLVLTSAAPVSARDLHIPEFYADEVRDAIPEGALVKTLPRPRAWAYPRADEAMLWQAVSGLHYRETGGYFIGGRDDAPVTYAAAADSLDILLEEHRDSPVPSAEELRDGVRELCRGGVDYILIADDGFYLPQPAPDIAHAVGAAAGVSPQHTGGVWMIKLSKEQGC